MNCVRSCPLDATVKLFVTAGLSSAVQLLPARIWRVWTPSPASSLATSFLKTKSCTLLSDYPESISRHTSGFHKISEIIENIQNMYEVKFKKENHDFNSRKIQNKSITYNRKGGYKWSHLALLGLVQLVSMKAAIIVAAQGFVQPTPPVQTNIILLRFVKILASAVCFTVRTTLLRTISTQIWSFRHLCLWWRFRNKGRQVTPDET